MKRLLIALTSTAAIAFAANADSTAWFNGGIEEGSGWASATGGAWSNTTESAEFDAVNHKVLVDSDDAAPLAFNATEGKAPANLKLFIDTTVKFENAYTEDPVIPGSDYKLGVIARATGSATNFYVLGKVDSANAWKDSGVAVTSLADPVAVAITVTNVDSAVYASYKFGSAEPFTTEIVAAGSFSSIEYRGSGEVTSLAATTEPTEVVAEVDGLLYYSIGDAFTAAGSTKNIILSNDVAEAVIAANASYKVVKGSFAFAPTTVDGYLVTIEDLGDGVFQYVSTQKSTADEVAGVPVSQAFVTGSGYADKAAADAAFASSETAANGLTPKQAYLLGLSKADAAIPATKLAVASGSQFKASMEGLAVPQGATPVFKVYNGDTLVATGSGNIPEITFDKPAEAGKYKYTIKAEVAGGTAVASTTVGVENVAATAGYAFAAVAWDSFSGGDIAPTALVDASGMDNNDQMDVFDAATETWDTYRVNNGEWEFVGEPGKSSPTLSSVKRGTAVKVKSAKAIYTIGKYNSAAPTVTLAAGKWNLLAKPEGAFTVSDETVGSGDKLFVMPANGGIVPDIQYIKYGTKWYKVPKVGKSSSESVTVDAGKAFFYINNSNKESIGL